MVHRCIGQKIGSCETIGCPAIVGKIQRTPSPRAMLHSGPCGEAMPSLAADLTASKASFHTSLGCNSSDEILAKPAKTIQQESR